ncbi:MAG: DUF547 domain-containing protein [Taibaiella sp.]|nr:DUF547 domain-containing protein [Taibaiella sp.]
MKKILLILLVCSSFSSIAKPDNTTPPANKIWTQLLKKYVNEEGWVNYKGFIKDKAEFQQYLDLLSDNPPQDSWSKDDKEAYWINAYNAFTIKLIIDHYPVKSIKDIGPKHQIPFVNTPWEKKFFKIGNEKYKLDRIEHHILRKQFDDPRVHFAIVCASRSCAKLRREAYEGNKLNEQLNEQAKDFLNDKRKNKISAEKPELSNYFDWYKKDFQKHGTVIEYINQYSRVKIHKDAAVSFMDYDWSLNEQK